MMPGAGGFGQQLLAMAGSVGPGSRLRYAPTPSGFLHQGNAYNFILNYLIARSQPGPRLLLRIDDLDAGRKRPEYVQDIFQTLHWLGLDWDEGPRDADEFDRHWSQLHRLELYRTALEQLRATGLVFACAKSRRDLAPYGEFYPESFRRQNLSLDTPDFAWRIQTPPGFPLPYFVVRRRDGVAAYQLASLADDRHFGITHIVRGEDLLPSTLAQQYLADCLGWTAFAQVTVLHHPLILEDQGRKLSKSAGSVSLQSHYNQGETPTHIYKQLASWLGWPEEGLDSREQLLETVLKPRTAGK